VTQGWKLDKRDLGAKSPSGCPQPLDNRRGVSILKGNRLKDEIAQRTLSDPGCVNHAGRRFLAIIGADSTEVSISRTRRQINVNSM
jgi:hypothetical protein